MDSAFPTRLPPQPRGNLKRQARAFPDGQAGQLFRRLPRLPRKGCQRPRRCRPGDHRSERPQCGAGEEVRGTRHRQ
ncbi:protein of unknown function [Cyanobium sp. NIES-981]|nr:protein of unknown function [Cyanobium sp. NIES-981]